ncbi:MAG TPA: antitoxin MazE family protein [Rhodospirillales bacterium]
MAATTNGKRSSREKVQNYRERMRARGLRPVQIWVPDTRTAGFVKEAHRQSLAVARSAHERKDQAFIDAITDHDQV